MKSINLGSGDTKINGVESCDINNEFKTDHCFDLKVTPWPLPDSSYSEVYLFHTIEHIEKKFHGRIFDQVHRILREDGSFFLSFPEFEIIAKNWLENIRGQREHWEHNIYGLQRTSSDYHVCAMDSEETKDLLLKIGFKNISICAEQFYNHNTVIRCQKGIPQKSYEEVVYEDVIK